MSRVIIDTTSETPKLEIVGEPVVVGRAISPRHPVHSVAWAPEDIGGQLVMAIAVQMCTLVVTFDGSTGEMVSKEEFKNNFIEIVSGMPLLRDASKF